MFILEHGALHYDTDYVKHVYTPCEAMHCKYENGTNLNLPQNTKR